MSVDIVLVSGERLTLASVRDRFADPAVRAALRPATIRGTPEEIAPHRWLIQLTASPTDLDGIHRARDEVRRHLGEDTFWSRATAEDPRVAFGSGPGLRRPRWRARSPRPRG